MEDSSYSDSQSPPPGASGGSTDARTNRDSIKKGFNDLMKFADVNISRAKQYVTEKAGKAESVTEFDEEFESMCNQMDQIKLMTERMIVQVVTLMQPNPNARLEDRVRTKLDRPKPARTNPYDLLSAEFTRAAEVFGKETQYGAYLARCGQVEHKVGESHRRMEEKVMKDVITPVKAFLEIDVKTILRDRKALNVRRLDLDARRANHRKAQGDKIATAEVALREAQSEYEQLLEKVRKALRKLVDTHVDNMGYLRSFMAAQRACNEECQAFLADMDAPAVASLTSQVLSVAVGGREGGVSGLKLDGKESRKARTLYDYDAVNSDEISINAGKILVVAPIPGDGEYLLAEYNGSTGKVPSTYIEYL